MEVLNYTEFKNNLDKNLKKITDDAEIVVVSRGKGKQNSKASTTLLSQIMTQYRPERFRKLFQI